MSSQAKLASYFWLFSPYFSGDSLSGHANLEFTTKDRDNDAYSEPNCATELQHVQGAWWYYACHNSNMNGLYLGGPQNHVVGWIHPGDMEGIWLLVETRWNKDANDTLGICLDSCVIYML